MNVKIVLKDATKEFDKEYTYSVPPVLEPAARVGARVRIPFGKGNTDREGYVLSIHPDESNDFFVKPILAMDSPCPVLREDQIRLVRQMRKKYTCTYGDAIRLMVPPKGASKGRTNRTAFLVDPQDASVMIDAGEFNTINQIRVVEYLLECEEAPVSEIIAACQITPSTLATLAKKQVIEYGKVTKQPELPAVDEAALQEPFARTAEQEKVICTILDADPLRYKEFLLHGITGSGKTEVYLQVIQSYLDQGFGSILLVPEISLTPQMIFRMKARFGEAVSVIHSRLSPKERFEQWREVIEGRVNIVVGARSAVFAPIPNLRCIIVDEEQESTYKSETHPKYHAVEIARLRMGDQNGLVILGSATPKVETYYQTQTGQSVLLELTCRIGEAKLPTVEIVDLREELANGNRSVFSRILKKKMLEAFAKKEQVMLFLNRRGHSGFFLCRDCGYVPKCPSCSVSLTYHSANNGLVCHYCGHIHPVPKTCPKCKSPRIGGFGAGTQQIEELCKKEFPDRVVLRMDQDTTTGRGSHARILEAFGKGEADVLIGTQMIAKGHDFQHVTVVGILSADLMLGISDFRSSERAFQLITQAAGRAGRGKKEGYVIIQAYNIDDYAVVFASRQDYAGFFRQEIAFRKAMQYPPFGTIGVIVISSPDEFNTAEIAKKIRFELKEYVREQCTTPENLPRVDVMELSKAPIFKIRDRYRYRIVLKSPYEEDVTRLFERVQNLEMKDGIMISFDLNPFHML
jgi:primosomal protein N' (replication factor Y)